MKNILSKLKIELNQNIDDKYKQESPKYHKEPVNYLGVRTPIVRKIAKKIFKEIKPLGKEKVFSLCEELFKSGNTEELTIAVQWAAEYNAELIESDFKIIKKWFSKYISNWGSCDNFCLNLLSHFIVKYPQCKQIVKSWTGSNNRWKRRASAVAFIQGGSWTIHSTYLNDVFDVALELMTDEDDLVQKGFGWMLKVAADTHQKEVFDFVIKHKKEMPRTSLRYAIEKMPQSLRKRAMEK